MAGILERYPALASVGVVPLGVSRFSREATMRAHSTDEVAAVLDYRRHVAGALSRGARSPARLRGRRVLPARQAALSRRPRLTRVSPSTKTASGWRRAFAEAFAAGAGRPSGRAGGFFRSVDGAPALGYRAPQRRRPGRRGVRRGRLRRARAAGDDPHRRLRPAGAPAVARRDGPLRRGNRRRRQHLLWREHRRHGVAHLRRSRRRARTRASGAAGPHSRGLPVERPVPRWGGARGPPPRRRVRPGGRGLVASGARGGPCRRGIPWRRRGPRDEPRGG